MFYNAILKLYKSSQCAFSIIIILCTITFKNIIVYSPRLPLLNVKNMSNVFVLLKYRVILKYSVTSSQSHFLPLQRMLY